MALQYDTLDSPPLKHGLAQNTPVATSRYGLILWSLLSKGFALASVILIAVFAGQYMGGFDWSLTTYSYHPVFMTTGFIYFFGDAMLVYRVLPGVTKMTAKVIHFLLQLVALSFVILGLYCMFNAKKDGDSNMRTLHSWIGLFTVLCFTLQLVGGLVTFLFPGLSTERRTSYKPVHVFWGIALFAMGGLACMLGLYGVVVVNDSYTDLSAYGLVANFFGICVVGTVLTTGYVLCREEYRRTEHVNFEEIPLH